MISKYYESITNKTVLMKHLKYNIYFIQFQRHKITLKHRLNNLDVINFTKFVNKMVH